MDKLNQSINNLARWENSNTLEFYEGCSCSGGWNGYQGGMGNAYCGGNAMSNGYGSNKKIKEGYQYPCPPSCLPGDICARGNCIANTMGPVPAPASRPK